MQPKRKLKLPFTNKLKKKYSYPVPIPPRSVISVRRRARSPWANKAGRLFTIGYYSKMDGPDCIWLVDENGKYDKTIDHECLRRFFDVCSIATEPSLYGRWRPQFSFMK
jgi:hypothetical protein